VHEFRISPPDGSLRWISIRGEIEYDSSGRAIRNFGVAQDVTERKRAEEERARLLVREQTARAEAEAANRAKDEFLATVSHELRTPLNAIFGWVRLLKTGKLDAAASSQAVDTIERNARAQAQLIEDLLDTSRIISGKLHLDYTPIDVRQTIATAVDTIRPAADAKSIQLTAELPAGGNATVRADPTRLQQIIWNLLSNAVKFTPAGGRVVIRLDCNHSEARITVADTGQGISPEFLPHVFERFQQADSKDNRQHGGLGLGLAIVHQLTESHGGTVKADSAGTDQGATFTLTLPLNSEATANPSTAEKPGSQRHGV
jgi:signal transduction histidine kinase